MEKLKYYHYGYRFINPQEKEEIWDYTIQKHKNQNGTHFDLRLAKPNIGYAYSWASKKPPTASSGPILARRTHDHSLEHLDFEGPLDTKRGKGHVTILRRGKAKLLKIDDTGIYFKLEDGKKYKLENLQGKKYLFKEIF